MRIVSNNRPKKGDLIKVLPIREMRAIKNIRARLADNPRNLCLFVVGINTALRASELRLIRVSYVRYLNEGDSFELKQPKTGRYRRVTVNQSCIEAIRRLLSSKSFDNDDYLFEGKRGVLTVPTICRLVKEWCEGEKLLRGNGNYGSHTLRKTWGYWQRQSGTSWPLISQAYGHATQKQTLEYLCIQDEEIENIYMKVSL
ncbi:MAG: tyrosine-type recombinase/integrase [Thiomargarita sp.]|nr:tyrosine-type recombinase/integrase [Thiomargarita sp.]